MEPVPAARHVLVVDDYPDSAQTLADFLQMALVAPVVVWTAVNGAEGVALAVSHPPDIVLLDYDMPLMNGIDTAIAIRFRLPGRLIRLICITANPDKVAGHTVFDHVLAKPVDLGALVDLLDAV